MLLVNRQLIAETVRWCFSRQNDDITTPVNCSIHVSKVLQHGAVSEHYINRAGKKLVWGWVAMDHEVYGSGWGWIGAGTGDPIPMQASSSN